MPENLLPHDIEEPDSCADMGEVRRGVDALDRAIIKLLAKRFGFMRAAARIKTDRHLVRDEDRKAQVIAQASIMAAEHDIPVSAIINIWETLVEASIAYEMEEWDHMRR